MGQRTDEPLRGADLSTATATGNGVDSPAHAQQIAAEIDQTRAELSGTIDALQERLSPQHLVADAKTAVADAAKEKVRDYADQANATAHTAANAVMDALETAGDVVRSNPFPAFVVLNLGLMAVARSWSRRRAYISSQPYPLDESDSGYMSSSAATGAAGGRTMANTMGDPLRRQSRRIQRISVRDNPMLVGFAAVAAGVLVGAMLPSSDLENEYMGDARDTLVSSVEGAVDQATEHVKEAVGQAVDTMTGTGSTESASGPGVRPTA